MKLPVTGGPLLGFNTNNIFGAFLELFSPGWQVLHRGYPRGGVVPSAWVFCTWFEAFQALVCSCIHGFSSSEGWGA